jgi:hypothetical protein
MAGIGLTAEQKDKIKPVVLEIRKQSKAVREDETLAAAAKQGNLLLALKQTILRRPRVRSLDA